MFLKGVIVAGGATALTAVSASHLADSRNNAAQAEAGPATTPQGYRETEHIKAFYRTLRD